VYSVYNLAVLPSSNYVDYRLQFKVHFSVGARDFSLLESPQSLGPSHYLFNGYQKIYLRG
jgi:hypothetical protein